MKYVDIVGKRNWFFALSATIILIGIIFGFVRGLNLDIDFKGGTITTINMKTSKFNPEDIKKIVNDKTGENNAVVLPAGVNKDQASIRTPKALTSQEGQALFQELKAKYNLSDKDLISIDTIDPLIGKELSTKGLLAVGISSLLTLLYLAWVFRNLGGWVAGLTAVAGVLHDVLILFTVYLVAHIPINMAFIAAALTILGYSMNDTIIVYDRIRENEKALKKMPIAELVNKSILQTLNRTINTVLTVVITVTTLYIFGVMNNVDALKEFTLPLLVGIISGTYSSIFICSMLYVMWMEHKDKAEKAARA